MLLKFVLPVSLLVIFAVFVPVIGTNTSYTNI